MVYLVLLPEEAVAAKALFDAAGMTALAAQVTRQKDQWIITDPVPALAVWREGEDRPWEVFGDIVADKMYDAMYAAWDAHYPGSDAQAPPPRRRRKVPENTNS